MAEIFNSLLRPPRWSKVRSLFKSMGFSDHDLSQPLIGLANSWNTIVPGHYNLRQVAEYVKQGVWQAGGTPLEFGIPACCDGVANGHEGNRYVLPSRELIASCVETMARAHKLDGLVLLGSCDKIVPGLLMGAARVDLPAILVPGGPALGGCQFDGRASDITSMAEALGMLQAGRISRQEYDALEDRVMPACGSCSFLGTANSMCSMAEGLGMCLPGTATIPAVHADRLRAAQASGRRVVELVKGHITARQIMSRDAVENGLALMMAMGGSTNAALHLTAIAYEAGLDLTLADFDRASRATPHLAKINPAAPANVPDFHAVGGAPAVLRQLSPLLRKDALSVSGQTLGQIAAAGPDPDGVVVRLFDDPFAPEGGLAVLRGNLAPNGAVSKPAAIAPDMRVFRGPAQCFESEEQANQAILDGRVEEGRVVVIRHEGPKGGPGMPEMATAMKLLYGRGLAQKTALITDGRFSGTNNGCFVGHISPEAAEGGPIALIEDGDLIEIDIPSRSLNLAVAPEILENRRRSWQAPKPRAAAGWLSVFAALATSADRGAVIPHRG